MLTGSGYLERVKGRVTCAGFIKREVREDENRKNDHRKAEFRDRRKTTGQRI